MIKTYCHSSLLALALLQVACSNAGDVSRTQDSSLADAAQITSPLGLWVWHDVDEKIAPESSTAFLDAVASYAPSNKTTLFLNIDTAALTQNASYQNNLRAFLQTSHQRGFHVQALGSGTTWIDQPQNAVDDFVVPTQQFDFDAIHFDVEAHQHPDWNGTNNETLLSNFLQLATQVSAAAQARPVYWDIPPWYFNDEAKVMVNENPVGEALMQLSILPVLMSYRTNVDEIESFSASAITYLSSHNIPWFFGAETSPNQPTELSYSGKCLEDLVSDINTLYAHRAMGTAIEHWDNLKLLTRCNTVSQQTHSFKNNFAK